MVRHTAITCVDLSNMGETKILGKVVITDESMGICELLGERARAAPLKSTPMIATHPQIQIMQ